MSSPQTASETLERTFLEIRARVIEVAAGLDRIERAEPAGSVRDDPRLGQIRESIEILNSGGFDRAERIQQIFSDEYEPNWSN